MSFFVYSGAGNTFLLTFEKNLNSQIAFSLCHMHDTDGLIFIEKREKDRFALTIYNKDGSLPSMCGNGLRCVAQFLFDQKMGESFQFETLDGIYKAEVESQGVKTFFPPPKKLTLNLKLDFFSQEKKVHFIFVGVPHLVIFDANPDVFGQGKAWRNHPYFAPEGTNVNFITDFTKTSLSVRTYERGVEGETLACGTGSVASALILASLENISAPLKVKVASQEILAVNFIKDKNNFKDLALKGPAQFIRKI